MFYQLKNNMNYSNEIIAKVIAPYLGQRLSAKEIYDGFTCELVVNNFTTSFQNGMTIGTAIQYHAKLILKPLSLITMDDAIEVCKIYGHEKGQVIINPKGDELTIIEFKRAEYDSSYIWLSLNTNEKWNIFVYQYLQSKGYDLPQFLLGGKTLEKAGLAIYEN